MRLQTRENDSNERGRLRRVEILPPRVIVLLIAISFGVPAAIIYLLFGGWLFWVLIFGSEPCHRCYPSL
jgi:hypothetical protein